MRIGRVVLIAGLLAVVPLTAYAAGDYLKSKDFSGQIYWVYKPSGSLFKKYRVYLAQYDANTGAVRMVIKTSKISDIECGGEFPLLLKTANGEVHRLQGEAKGEPPVCLATVQADWVKSNFTLRVYTVNYLGMRPESNSSDAEFDTSDLDLSRIAIAPTVASNAASVTTSDRSESEAAPPDVGSAQLTCVDGAGANVEAFHFKIIGTEWTDKILRPGMEMVPPAQLGILGDRAYIRPQVSFLVVTLQVTNTKNVPLELSKAESYWPAVVLKNSQGAMFKDSGVSDIGRKTDGGLNPGIPVQGTLAFDVPKSSYQLEIYWVTKDWVKVVNRKAYECSIPLDS